VFLAEEALSMGLVNYVCEPDQLITRAREYALDLARNVSPASMAVMKQQVWQGMQQVLADSNEMADVAMRHSLKQADFKEGVASFVEKRPPNFAPYSG
jgi:enoyl-CoA hydratase/carnithine racemase